MASPEPLNLDVIKQRIDELTAQVPLSMTRTDIVTWFMINYLAGVRDVVANFEEVVPWSLFGSGPNDEEARRAAVNMFTRRMGELAATTSWPRERP